MSHGIKPDPNCPLISQSLLKSGAIHKLTAKYLLNVITIARQNKKIPYYSKHTSESFQIADELVLKYLTRFELKYTYDAFRIESNFTFSNPNLPVKRLVLTYSQDPLKNFLKIIEKSPRLRFHDTLVIQALLVKVPALIDDNTKAHFINILKKAGNFTNADENAIFRIIQNNNNKYKNKNEAKDIKKTSHSDTPKQPQELSEKSNSPDNSNENSQKNNQRDNTSTKQKYSQRNRNIDMTDNRSKSREAYRRNTASSCSFNSSSSKEDKTLRGSSIESESNPQAVVAQITCSDHNAYSCNLIDGKSESDSISESNLAKNKITHQNFSKTQNAKQNRKKNTEHMTKNSTISEYAHSASSYTYEYETISEPEQEQSENSVSSNKSEFGQLKGPNAENDSHLSKSQKIKKPTEQKPANYNIARNLRVTKTSEMSLADQMDYFDFNNKNPKQFSPFHKTQPSPSPRVYTLPVPEDYEDPRTKKSKKSKNAQEVIAKISELEKELEALKSDGESDSYSSEHEDSKIAKLQRTLANAVKESSSAIKRGSTALSSSDDDDKSQSQQYKNKTSSKTSFGATLLAKKENAKTVQHHRSRVYREEKESASIIITESVSSSNKRQSNEKEDKKSIVVLKSSENPSRNRTISEQKIIDKMNEKANKSNRDSSQKTKEAPPVDNQPETFRLTLPTDPFKVDKKSARDTNQQRQSQNQKQSSRLNQNQKPSQSQSQSQRISQVQKPAQNQRPVQQQKQQPLQHQQKNQTKSQQQFQRSSKIASSEDELISDSPPPAMKQLWESKSKNKGQTKTSSTSNKINDNNKNKDKIDDLSKISNQNSSSSLYDAFVEAEKREKIQNQIQERNPAAKEQSKKKEEPRNNNSSLKQTHPQQKIEPSKSSVITFKQPANEPEKPTKTTIATTNSSSKANEQSKSTIVTSKSNSKTNEPSKPTTTISTSTSKANEPSNAAISASRSASIVTSSTSKYTTHAKTGSSMSTSKYTNHSKPSDSNLNANTNSKFTSHANATNSSSTTDSNLDKISTISNKNTTTRTSSTISQNKESAMRTLQPKNRSDNHSVEPKKLGYSQRLFLNQKSDFDSGSQSESFRIPLQKTRLVRAKMLSDLSEADFDDSSSSITERRRLPPLKVEIPYHDGHAKAFKNYYDFLSSSENFDLDKENGPIKRKIKEKLLKRSSSVNPTSMMPRRSATATATSKEENIGIKRSNTSNKVLNIKDNPTAVKDEKKENPTNNNNNKVEAQPPKNNSNLNTIKTSSISNRTGSENPKPSNTSSIANNNNNNNNANSNSFTAQITVFESEDLSRVDTYFVLYIDGSNQAKRTRTVKGKTKWKEFSELFNFTITREKCNIVIQAKREDLINGDQLISSAKVNLITLPLHKRHDKWVPLNPIGRVRLIMIIEKDNSTAIKNPVQNQPQAALKAVTGSNKDAVTYSLADEDKKKKILNTENPDLKILIKMTDEGKKDDPLLKSLVKSISDPKNLDIDQPTVNVPLLSESSSSDSDSRSDDKSGAKKKVTRSRSRSKSRNKSRKSKK